jgi:uncharacterized membrane protein YphA (DoxX/SURF4 family)
MAVSGYVCHPLGQILKSHSGPAGTDSLAHLGYPMYFLTLLGIAKILGVIVVLSPRLPLLKEWAYAGFTFMMIGAIYSHIAVDYSFLAILPALWLLILAVTSWWLRPASRRNSSAPSFTQNLVNLSVQI